MTTAVLKIGSDLVRRKWMREGMIQAASKSFWSPFTGMSKDSVVYQQNNNGAAAGHTVIFDFSGNITGRSIKGKDTAYGKGEEKRKFSDKITVERHRLVVDNGDDFDGVNIGDLNITQHSDSRHKLADLYIRWKDQMLFDVAQGNLTDETTGVIQSPSHVIDLNGSFDFDALLSIENILKTSNGYSTGGIRRPVEPYSKADNTPMWLLIIDSAMANKLRSDTAGYQTIVRSGDVRGENNRNIKGIIGRMGRIMILEADQFFGSTLGSARGWRLENSNVELCGLRQYAGTDPTTAPWTGQTGFSYDSADLHSRGLILGAGAIQMAMGKMPDYKFQSSKDFAITSESAVEYWTAAKKTKLVVENTDYEAAKIADIDYGVVVVDLEL